MAKKCWNCGNKAKHKHGEDTEYPHHVFHDDMTCPNKIHVFDVSRKLAFEQFEELNKRPA